MRWLVTLIVVAVFAPAWAQGDDKPWARGVTETEQKAALDLYKAGNASFEQSEYKAALEKYTLALAKWDHPAIRYNAAVCLFNLDRPVEAYEYLVAALRFGEAPLGHDLFAQANNYMKLLSSQVGELEVACFQAHAKITLDGTPIAECPSTGKRHLIAKNPHQLVAELRGYKTQTRELRIEGGKTSRLEIRLELDTTKQLVRRWPRWVPWAVAGGGAVVAGAGAVIWNSSREAIDHYDSACQKNTAPGTSYCLVSALPPSTVSDYNHAHLQLGGGLAIGGAAVLAAGIALVILNAPHEEHAPLVAPSIGPDHAGVTLVGSF